MIIKDSIVVSIPCNITADMGVVMKRTRAKRLRKLKEWEECYFGNRNGTEKTIPSDGNQTLQTTPSKLEKADCNGADGDSPKNENETNSDLKSSEEATKPSDTGSISKTKPGEDTTGNNCDVRSTDIDSQSFDGTPKRENFGSVLDYLEAKYVRGIMIPDVDDEDSVARKKKKKKKKRKLESTDGSDANKKRKDDDAAEDLNDDEDDDEQSTGSVYSDVSGNFIDDGLLQANIAEQVVGSSTYNATKIENEAQEGRKNTGRQGSGDDSNMVNNGVMDEYTEESFFVNIGELEMAHDNDKSDAVGENQEGYKSGTAHVSSGIDYNALEKTVADAAAASQSKSSSKKRHRTKGKVGKENGKDKGKSGDKTPKLLDPTVKRKKKSSLGSLKASTPKSSHSKSKVVRKKVSSESAGANAQLIRSSEDITCDDGHDVAKETIVSPLSGILKASEETLKPLRNRADILKKEQRRLYKVVLKEIKKMTEEQLPRKSKVGSDTIKVTIKLPPNSGPGDMIPFKNPRIPGQMLRVKAPKNAVPGGKFNVLIPAPDRPKSIGKNTFPDDCKYALDAYSRAYDDWVDAEARYRELVPGAGIYKPMNERLKKFETLLKELPNDLLHPIDAAYLRKVVRRTRQNVSKRRKTAATNLVKAPFPVSTVGHLMKEEDESVDGSKDDRAPTEKNTLHVPIRGVTFPPLKFDFSEFTR